MLFSSITFLYSFLPAVVIIYFMAPVKFKNTVLLIASLVFYAWGEQMLVCILIATIILGWLFGILIEIYPGHGKLLMSISISADLGALGYFKYAGFFIENLARLFPGSLPVLKVALPIGISFYTFQIISYTIDVYKGRVKAQRNLVDFATYVALFPQLIAGPVVRYADISSQLKNRSHSLGKAAEGTTRFIIGLGKKVLIANLMGEVCTFFRETSDSSMLYAWMYAIAFVLQIYYDFSGYSDMAIGLGKIFGFELMENFNYPYISKSITEFWRRWHISLGSWFRDYVYIPLGGNRRGMARQLANILIVWSLTGLWHGAAWNFVLWGLFYGLLLTIEKLFLLKWLEKMTVFCHMYTLFMVTMGFIIFNATDFSQIAGDFATMFGGGGLPVVSAEAAYYLKSYAIIYVVAITGATPLPKALASKLMTTRAGYLRPFAMGAILLIVTAYLIDGSFNPFLYFRF